MVHWLWSAKTTCKLLSKITNTWWVIRQRRCWEILLSLIFFCCSRWPHTNNRDYWRKSNCILANRLNRKIVSIRSSFQIQIKLFDQDLEQMMMMIYLFVCAQHTRWNANEWIRSHRFMACARTFELIWDHRSWESITQVRFESFNLPEPHQEIAPECEMVPPCRSMQIAPKNSPFSLASFTKLHVCLLAKTHKQTKMKRNPKVHSRKE